MNSSSGCLLAKGSGFQRRLPLRSFTRHAADTMWSPGCARSDLWCAAFNFSLPHFSNRWAKPC
jgi:hypothetical protein